MMTQYPAGIVVDIPEPIRSRIQSIRESLSTITAKLPVEITVAGSSGLGFIPPGTYLSKIIGEIDRIASEIVPFEVSFSEIRSFPNSFIFYLAPSDRKLFDSLHRALCVSSIPFSESPFPFIPHCTLRDGEPLTQNQIDGIFSIPFPKESFLIDSISIYEIPVYNPNEGVSECNLLYHRSLRPGQWSKRREGRDFTLRS